MFFLGGYLEYLIRKIFEGPIGVASRFLRHDYNVVDIVYKNAAERSAKIVETRMQSSIVCRSKESLWRLAAENAESDGLWLEFGVFRGRSINFLSHYCKKIYGFDSFEGLSEDWSGNGHRKGSFNLGGKPPSVKKNVELIVGYFESTLDSFLCKNKDSRIALVHLDCDTYESTSYVLEKIKNYTNNGTVIIFDDYFGAPGFEMGQLRALDEYLSKYSLPCKYLAYSRQSIAIKLTK